MLYINRKYIELLENLIFYGQRVGNTLELNNVKISFPKNYNPFVTLVERNLSERYALGELIWYFAGSNSMNFISKFSSFWKKISDDGVTSNSAYGYIIQKKHNFDQMEQVIETLTKDPNSRRALININTPNSNRFETKDEPCTIALQFFIRKGKLNMTSIMRSNDIWFGFPYDVIYFKALQTIIANRLGIKIGSHTHFVSSLHLYDRDYEKAMKVIYNKTENPKNDLDFLTIFNQAKALYEVFEKEETK